MKTKTFLLSILVCLSFACENEEPKDDTEKQTTIDGEEFTPTESSVVNNGENLVLTFQENSKSIEITTNDTIAGIYEITTQSVKSTTLMANLLYSDGTLTYTGKSGSVTITDEGNGMVSGSYSATVVSEENIELEISSGSFSEIEVEVEEETPPPVTEESINDTLVLCYNNLNSFVEFTFLFDAVYSNKVSAPSTSWDAIHGHSQSTTDEMVEQMWNDAWDVILQTNFVIENAEEIIADTESKNIVIAQANAIRSYTYYTLLTWFGSLPIILEYEPETWSRSSQEEVLEQIVNDANAALDNLPIFWSETEDHKVTKTFVQGLLCRVYLTKQEFANAMNMAQQIINSANYSLDATVDNITETSSEIYWGFAKSSNEEFNSFFTKGSYVPIIRYTESILVFVESAYNMGQQMEAMSYMNMLKYRRGESEILNLNADAIFNQWDVELVNEGNVFNTLKRFEKVPDSLQLQDFKLLLPIPQFVIENNPNMLQNPGY